MENYSIFLERGDILPKQGELLINKDELVEKFEKQVHITLQEISKEGDFLKSFNKLLHHLIFYINLYIFI